MSFLADRGGQPWEGDGAPSYLILERDEDARKAVRRLPPAALAEAWTAPWTALGIEPPLRTVTELRRELEKRARQVLKDEPRTQFVPISEAARKWAIPERTLRARIARGALEASWSGRGELALELPVTTPVRVPLPRTRPDPRVLWAMARAPVTPGGRFGWCMLGSSDRQTYRRRIDGANWREADRW